MTFKDKSKGGLGKFLFGTVALSLVAGGGFLFFSPMFEKEKPKIEIENSIYWNLKDHLKIDISDNGGLKYYKVIFNDGSKDIELSQNVLDGMQKQLTIDVTPPKLDMFYKATNGKLKIEVVDNSKWNFLEGNKAIKTVDIKIDRKKPTANILANSRYIQRGGSATVVVEVKDTNLKDAYINFNNQERFELLPYKKEGFYMALIAWPIDIEEFQKVSLVAIDKANNKTVTKIPFYYTVKKIKRDNIKLSKKFIENVSKNVLEQSGEAIPDNLVDIFVYSNKDLRAKNLDTIKKVGLNALKNTKIVEDIKIKRFKRLRGSRTVANYGERRSYFLDGKKINEAWHLGIDWASVKHAPIKVSNSGTVVFKDWLGLYGNTIIIDHGAGLCSLYAHTSSQDVELGDNVRAKQKIANTGSTGGVFGDHLHFGIVVQGVEVNPLEWMDRNWIKTRVTNILKEADKIIDSK